MMTQRMHESAAAHGLAGRASLGQVIVHHFPLLIAVMVVGGLVGVGISSLLPQHFRADITLYQADVRSTGVFGGAAPSAAGVGSIRALLDRARASSVFEEAALRLEAGSPAEIEERITVSADPEIDGLAVSATAPSPSEAARTLQAYVDTLEDTLVRERREWAKQVTDRLVPLEESLSARLAALDEALTTASAIETPALSAERATVFDSLLDIQLRSRELATDADVTGPGIIRAGDVEVPEQPVTPGPVLLTAAGILLGLLGATIVAWRRLERAPQVRDRRDPLRVIDAPLIGELAAATRHTGNRPGVDPTAMTGHLRLGGVVRSLQVPEDGPPVLHVRGVAHGDDADAVALAIGMQVAQGGRRVVVCGVARADPDITPERGAERDRASAFVSGAGTVRVLNSPQPPSSTTADLVVVSCGPVLDGSGGVGEFTEPPPVVLAVNRGRAIDQLLEASEVLQFEGDVLLGYVYVDAPTHARRRARSSPRRDVATAQVAG